MLRSLLHITLLTTGITGLAQFGPQQIIYEKGGVPLSIFSLDFTGDGAVDVLTASKGTDEVFVFQNTDGLGNFSGPLLVGLVDQTIFATGADIDGDGDNDVVAISGPGGLVAWFENQDGQGTFGMQENITQAVSSVYSVTPSDIDGDGDTHLLVGSDGAGLNWIENEDGLGGFGPVRPIDASLPVARSVVALDADADGDLDVVSSSAGAVTLSWYENLDGTGNFGTQQVILGNGSTIQQISSGDLDGDGDLDVAAVTNGNDKVAWYENLDDTAGFGPEQVVSTNVFAARSVCITDIDTDGANDIIAGGNATQPLVWFQNTNGAGVFSQPQTITDMVEGPTSIHAADVDGDGDMDVLSTSGMDYKIAWYENLTILGTADFNLEAIKIYPNPAQTQLFLEHAHTVSIARVVVSSVLGETLLRVQKPDKPIDVSTLSEGVYVVTIETTDGSKGVKKFVKE